MSLSFNNSTGRNKTQLDERDTHLQLIHFSNGNDRLIGSGIEDHIHCHYHYQLMMKHSKEDKTH